MTTILIIGDPHFKVSNIGENEKMVEAVIKIAKERQPDIIVVLGDVMNDHETVRVTPLVKAINFLDKLMNIAQTYVLIGNHDLKNNKQFLSMEHPFTALKLIPNNKIIIVDQVISTVINDQTFTFMPYVPTGRFMEALQTNNEWKDATCIFAHQEFKGCQMGAITSVDGDVYPIDNPFVISGHIHDYQRIQENIVYIGTPIQHTYSDADDKTISYFTFVSPKERYEERISLGLPRKSIVNLTCGEVPNYVPKLNSMIRFKISGYDGELKAIMKHQNINIWKHAGHKVTYKTIPLPDEGGGEMMIPGAAPPSFSTALRTRIEDNHELTSLFVEIFGDDGKSETYKIENNLSQIPIVIPNLPFEISAKSVTSKKSITLKIHSNAPK